MRLEMQLMSSQPVNLFSFCHTHYEHCHLLGCSYQLLLDKDALITIGCNAENAFLSQATVLHSSSALRQDSIQANLKQVVLHLHQHSGNARAVTRQSHPLDALRRQTKLSE